MGVGDGDAVADDGGRSKLCEISCSICMEAVADDGTRSLAKLLCGHQFHLDCIGSAFNVKGAMQCPNCRKVEKGQWLYASGSRSLPDLVMDDWTQEEDTFDLSYSEMAFGVHWCPFSGLTRITSSFDEGEFPSSTYHDLLGHHEAYVEPTPVSSTNHPCPYIYLAPIHPSNSASNHGGVNVPDASTYSSHWSGPSLPSDVVGSYAFPAVDVRYHNWDHSPPFVAPTQHISAPRTARNSSDIPRSSVQPFILGHNSASRAAPSSVTQSMVQPYSTTVSRLHHRETNHQQSTINPQVARVPSVMSNGRRSGAGHRGASAHVAAPMVASSSAEHQHNGGFYFYSSARNPEAAHWEHDYHQPSPFPERDSSSSSTIWGPLYPTQNGAGSYGSRAWHGSSQNRS